ncbi:MAG: anthranilate phosphoribosyltransferase [Hyphomicrobiales bacterium]|nr:anthranilate phosphoribosyltransferase [Hyphomicrobiales bacterium]
MIQPAATDLKPFIAKAAAGLALTRDEARQAFNVIMSGEATPSQIGGFLMALRVRGESIDEIAGAVEVMRSRMLRVSAPAGALDIVGTGGDGSGSLNISTASAIVAAGCGVPIAKHGNRALSSRSGTADTLAALGVKIELGPEAITHCIRTAGIGFMFAPAHHAAMKHVGPTRVELATRTIFNMLGPLSNPAGVRRQLVGVFAETWVEPLAIVLGQLGAEHVWVMHASDGLDEITVSGETSVAEYRDGTVRLFSVKPEDAGLKRYPRGALAGGDAKHNAEAIRAMLDGEPGAHRDAVLLNAGAGLIVAGKVSSLAEGAAMAAQAIDNGNASAVLARLIAASQE